jgi:hypothetical protein
MIPFYVGKGNADRMKKHRYDALSKNKDGNWLHNKPHHKLIRDLVSVGCDIIYQKPFDGLTETQALNKERVLIEQTGRIIDNTGPLLNISRGGQRGGETCKPVTQYTLTGLKIATYPSALMASEATSANRSYITQCCKGRHRSSGGFLWAYEGDPIPHMQKTYWRKVVQYDISGILVAYYTSLTEAQKCTGIELHNISECCRGKSNSAGGFVWRYV